MYRVEGLIDYYFQRKRTGMDIHTIQQSLESQQHIEDDDRSTILQEVLRREEVQRKNEARKRLILISGAVGLAIVSFLIFFAFKS